MREKNKMKHFRSFGGTLLMLLMTLFFSLSAEAAQTSGYWEYETYGNTAVITKYTGSSNTVTIPNTIDGYTVVEVGNSAFKNNTNLRKIHFPEKLKVIGDSAFNECKNLTEITLPENLKDIGGSAFGGCEGLEKITVESAELNELPGGDYNAAFSNAGKRAADGIKVIFTDKVVKIPKNMFRSDYWGYVYIKNVEIGGNVKEIGANAFYGSKELETVSISADAELDTIDECAFEKNEMLKKIQFPSKLKAIKNSAFNECKNLTEITLPENLKDIGGSAFGGCEGLEKITVESAELNELPGGDYNAAFSNAGKRAADGIKVIFTDKVVKIPKNMFRSDYWGYVYIKNVEIGRNVKEIGKYTFNGCKDLEKVTILSRNCMIYDEKNTLGMSDKTVVYGHSKSNAESYAKKYGYKFVALETPKVVSVFSDVYIDWYVDYAEYVYQNKLMTGISGTKEFQPGANISKAQVAQVLYNMDGKKGVSDKSAFRDLNDVYEVEWYADAVAWAYSKGIVTGDLNTKKFSPNASVTREQLSIMMFRYAKYKHYDVSASNDLSGLKNNWKVSSWALDGVKWAVGSGIISGVEKNGAKDLAPQGTATRAQMAAILTRFCENMD